MTTHDHSLLAYWQANKHLPPAERLEEHDYEMTLAIVDFSMNAPADLIEVANG